MDTKQCACTTSNCAALNAEKLSQQDDTHLISLSNVNSEYLLWLKQKVISILQTEQSFNWSSERIQALISDFFSSEISQYEEAQRQLMLGGE